MTEKISLPPWWREGRHVKVVAALLLRAATVLGTPPSNPAKFLRRLAVLGKLNPAEWTRLGQGEGPHWEQLTWRPGEGSETYSVQAYSGDRAKVTVFLGRYGPYAHSGWVSAETFVDETGKRRVQMDCSTGTKVRGRADQVKKMAAVLEAWGPAKGLAKRALAELKELTEDG